MKILRDAVHGDMGFDELEIELIDTPAIQRLRGIKQLGTSSLVFPSAVHTRFEHSLGTAWLTRRLLGALADTGRRVSDEDGLVARLAALLHDVGHVPFGHTFEDERRLFDRHDEDPARLDYFLGSAPVARALERCGVGARVRRVLLGEPDEPAYLRGLVRGAVCADLLDYLERDALFCGLGLRYDERLYKYFSIADGQLVFRLYKEGLFRRDALSELVHLLQIRYSLTERVYFHHAKVVSGAMVSRAVELALDEGLLSRSELYELKDDSLLDRLEQRTRGRPELAAPLADLSTRRLYKRVYFLALEGLGRPGISLADRDRLAERFHFDPGQRRALERRIADALSIPESEVIVYCPSPKMSLKEADVLVETARGQVQPLSSLGHPDVTALAEKHAGLWRFYVLLRRSRASDFGRAAAIAAELVGHENQLDVGGLL